MCVELLFYDVAANLSRMVDKLSNTESNVPLSISTTTFSVRGIWPTRFGCPRMSKSTMAVGSFISTPLDASFASTRQSIETRRGRDTDVAAEADFQDETFFKKILTASNFTRSGVSSSGQNVEYTSDADADDDVLYKAALIKSVTAIPSCSLLGEIYFFKK